MMCVENQQQCVNKQPRVNKTPFEQVFENEQLNIKISLYLDTKSKRNFIALNKHFSHTLMKFYLELVNGILNYHSPQEIEYLYFNFIAPYPGMKPRMGGSNINEIPRTKRDILITARNVMMYYLQDYNKRKIFISTIENILYDFSYCLYSCTEIFQSMIWFLCDSKHFIDILKKSIINPCKNFNNKLLRMFSNIKLKIENDNILFYNNGCETQLWRYKNKPCNLLTWVLLYYKTHTMNTVPDVNKLNCVIEALSNPKTINKIIVFNTSKDETVNFTPIHITHNYYSTELKMKMMELLFQYGADADTIGSTYSLLFSTLQTYPLDNNNIYCIDLILKNNADINKVMNLFGDTKTSFSYSCLHNPLIALKMLDSSYTKPNLSTDYYNDNKIIHPLFELFNGLVSLMNRTIPHYSRTNNIIENSHIRNDALTKAKDYYTLFCSFVDNKSTNVYTNEKINIYKMCNMYSSFNNFFSIDINFNIKHLNLLYVLLHKIIQNDYVFIVEIFNYNDRFSNGKNVYKQILNTLIEEIDEQSLKEFGVYLIALIYTDHNNKLQNKYNIIKTLIDKYPDILTQKLNITYITTRFKNEIKNHKCNLELNIFEFIEYISSQYDHNEFKNEDHFQYEYLIQDYCYGLKQIDKEYYELLFNKAIEHNKQIEINLQIINYTYNLHLNINTQHKLDEWFVFMKKIITCSKKTLSFYKKIIDVHFSLEKYHNNIIESSNEYLIPCDGYFETVEKIFSLIKDDIISREQLNEYYVQLK